MPNSNESSESEFSNENQQNIINRNSNSLSKKNRHHQNYSKNIYIGTKNAEKWDNIRTNLSFKNDVEFVTYLLELSEKEQLRKNGCNNNIIEKPDDFNKPAVVDPENLQSQTFQKKTKKVKFQEDELNDEVDGVDEDCSGVSGCTTVTDKYIVEKCPPLFLKTKSFINDDDDDKDDEIDDDKKIIGDDVILDCRIAEKIKSDEKVLCLSFNVKDLNDEENPDEIIQSKKRKHKTVEEDETIADIIQTRKKHLKKFNKKRFKHDIRKAPLDAKLSKELYELEEDDGMDEYEDEDDSLIFNKNLDDRYSSDDDYSTEDYQEIDETVEKQPRTKKIKIRRCSDCNTKHIPNECFIKKSINQLNDSISLQQWREQNNVENVLIKSEDVEGGDDDDDDESFSSDGSLHDEEVSAKKSKPNNTIKSFAEASIPAEFEIRKENDFSIFTKTVIPKYTKLGPLLGVVVPETDIIDDNNMKFIIETYNGNKSIFISMENKNNSNWLRFLRPAPTRELRNLTLVCVDGIVFFITCTEIDVGYELLYWSDEINSAWDKKKIERTNCGGCNLKFEHHLYYRTHCSVFHDPSFSLTIRKYHCKVCGAAVLGKENIIKHAAQMHEGKGAYQCQYCKKFFLRLNYLEMHRTYGCSANPQRARPLCDFCGRKFCQPQKLKVHIKRMHSDMAEVLRDFQCKLCSKLLGSRAALQRHSKEVHSRNSTVVSCPRCQKLFQNRSNLKIHMLTHSGVRPFRCINGTCSAAFTTKQCLQFHYKKVHGYAQEQMPKIERSVAYTFDAYSGGVKIDKSGSGESIRRRRQLSEDDQISMDNENEELFFEQETSEQKFEERQSSISNICKNETNLSLLSTTISSFLNQEMSREKKQNLEIDDEMDDDDVDEKNKIRNPQLNLVETFLSSSHDMSLIPTNNKPKEHEYNPNLIVSKGSKKWIDSDDHEKLNEPNLLNMNRDFISKLMDENESCGNHDNDDDNSILDVVETQNPQNSFHLENNENLLQLQHLNSSSHHQSSIISSFYNNNNRGSTISTSASLLVEAALSSVSNIIGNENENCSNLMDERNDCGSVQHDLVIDQNRSYDQKFMKNLNNFSHLIPMGQFSGSPSNNASPHNVLGNNHEIDIDSASTPRTMDHSDKIYQETNDQSFDHRNTPSPRAISPGHDYSATLCPSTPMRSYSNHNIVSPPASPGLPRYNFSSKSCRTNIRDHLNNMSSDEENSIIVAQNLSMNNHENVNTKMKLNPHMDLLYSKYEHDTLSHEENELSDRMKYNNDHGMDMSDLRNNTHSESISDFQGLDMTSRSGLGIGSGYHTSNFQMPSSGMNLTLNRYHHHIYDILSERDQQQQQQQQHEHHQHPIQQQQQQIQHMIQDQLSSDQDQTDQATSVDLSRTASYVSSPPQLQYSHSHSDMLRMVSLDLTPNGGPSGMLTNSHLRHSLSSQIQHSSRELDHNRILTDNRVNSSDQLTTNHRLLVDPTAHLLMEQNNRILESNRILPRGFGAYHHQVSSNYHHRPGGLSTSPHSNNPTNYHSFSAYY